jgi:hypothetical protein
LWAAQLSVIKFASCLLHLPDPFRDYTHTQFAYVTHAAWERIVDKLVVGQPAYLYRYSNICPHDDPDLCQCPKRTCFIEDNKLYGTRDGVTLRLVIVPGLTDEGTWDVGAAES